MAQKPHFSHFGAYNFFLTVKPELCLHHTVELRQCYISCLVAKVYVMT